MPDIVRFEEFNLLIVELEQNYIQSATESSDEDRKTSEEKRLENLRKSRQRIARGEIQVWAEIYMFPDEKRQEIMNIFDENWKEDIQVNVENLFLILPPELKSYIKHHLCFHMLEKVSSSGSICFLINILSSCMHDE